VGLKVLTAKRLPYSWKRRWGWLERRGRNRNITSTAPEPINKGLGDEEATPHQSQQQSPFTPALEAENARLRDALINAVRHLHAAAIWFGSHGPGHAAEQEEFLIDRSSAINQQTFPIHRPKLNQRSGRRSRLDGLQNFANQLIRVFGSYGQARVRCDLYSAGEIPSFTRCRKARNTKACDCRQQHCARH